METFATVFAGLGLFFIGLNGLTKAMRALASRGVHSLVQNATSNSGFACLSGVILGAATQSATAVTFISASMVSSGVIALTHGMLITAWSNIGATLLVFLATIDIHIYLYFFIGLLGVAYYFGLDRTETKSKLITLFVGLAILMLGIQLIKSGAALASENPEFMAWLANGDSHFLLLFLIGFLMSLVTQSATSVSAIIVALVAAGIFDFYQAAALILGANLGVAVSVYIIGRHLSGYAKRVVLTQAFTKVAGLIVVIPFFLYDLFTDMSVLRDTLSINDSILLGVSLLVLVIQVLASVIITIIVQPMAEWLSKHVDDDASEEQRLPKYIHNLALDDSESALDLLEKEHFRVIAALPRLLDDFKSPKSIVNIRSINEALRSLVNHCDQFCVELIKRNQATQTLERVLKAQRRNNLLMDISHNLEELLEHLTVDDGSQVLRSVKSSLLEGLHFILMFFDDAKHDLNELEMLQSITGDKSSVMESAREALVKTRHHMSEEVLTGMLSATSKFERLIWLINSYCQGLKIEVEIHKE